MYRKSKFYLRWNKILCHICKYWEFRQLKINKTKRNITTTTTKSYDLFTACIKYTGQNYVRCSQLFHCEDSSYDMYGLCGRCKPGYLGSYCYERSMNFYICFYLIVTVYLFILFYFYLFIYSTKKGSMAEGVFF